MIEEKLRLQKTFFVLTEKCTGCCLCELICSLTKEGEANLSKARIQVSRLTIDGLMIPHICRNCREPPCIKACRRKAINKDAETGWVTIDKQRCNNCTLCIPVCPYQAIVLTPEHEVLLCDVCDGNPKCVEICPTQAIQFTERVRGTVGMSR
jgi:Fe-S-cluster-containing hydrogenase component 2